MDHDSPTHIYLNPIKPDRADDWESFVRSTIMPAVARHRPDQLDRVRLLRAGEEKDGATLFAFLFDGGDIDDFDLEPVLTAEYGEEEGQARLREWEDMFASDQYGWTFDEVSLRA